jgi:hypothetical protein
MYHFTFIDKTASADQHQNRVEGSEPAVTMVEKSTDMKNIFEKTAYFQRRYADQNKGMRIFISKN